MRHITATDIESLYNEQMPRWELLRRNYELLQLAQVRDIDIDGVTIRIQHNPARITSVTSSPTTQGERPCFLCDRHLPQEQLRLAYDNQYTILVNPYPIFAHHYTVPTAQHTPQRIAGRMGTMLDIAHDCAPYTIFYNGPQCGASAPMHMHFQVAQPGLLPIEQQWRTAAQEHIETYKSATMSVITSLLRPIILITARHKDDAVTLFDKLYDRLLVTNTTPASPEPMMNIIARYEADMWLLLIFPRQQHRPSCYHATDNTQRLISPASVEMGGLIITPRHEDYIALTAQDIKTIYSEVSPANEELIKRLKL